jgi:hypothetical protein
MRAARLVMEAHTRSEQDAARDLTVAIEQLENAAGGERRLLELLEKPKSYVSDLKQSAAQGYWHAASTRREVIDHVQRLARAQEIVGLYITKRAASA